MARGGVGERADGDEIHAGRGDAGDGLERHAAAGLELHAARAELHGFGHLRGRHVVEQDDIHAHEREKAADLIERVGFELDAQAGILGAEAADGLLQVLEIGVRGEMVVLHHDHVEEPEAVILPAARDDRGLFQRAQAGRGLAGVEDARLGAGRRHRRNAA